MVGSKTKDGVVKVGDILAVPQNMLPTANYTALGHIHTQQSLGNNAYYSGAINKLSVGQPDMSVTIFESESREIVDVRQITLKNTARYDKVTATSIENAEELLVDFDDSDIVELEIVQSEPLSASSIKSLRKNFACISNISLIKTGDVVNVETGKKRKFLSDEELFKEFYKSVRGVEPSADLIKMYIECKGGSDETD